MNSIKNYHPFIFDSVIKIQKNLKQIKKLFFRYQNLWKFRHRKTIFILNPYELKIYIQ